jgi:AraC family transcriptional regulator
MTVRVIRFAWAGPADDVFVERDVDRLDLSLTPRPPNARARYVEYWRPDRFERLGDVMFVPAGEALHVKGDGAKLASINCLFHVAALRASFEDDFGWNHRRLDQTLDVRSQTIGDLVLRLGQEARCPGFASGMLAELIAGQLAIELFRYSGGRTEHSETGGLAAWRLRLIDDRLVEQRPAPSLAELAALCNLSVRHLARGFRASRGCSIGEYVAQRQIDHAKRLLTTDESTKSIAYTLGFATSSSFIYAFREATGQTPRQFRRNH